MRTAGEGINALVIEDNPGDARLIRELLRDAAFEDTGVKVTVVDRLSTGLDRLATETVDLVLLDLSLPDSSGLATFEAVHSAAPQVPVVVLSGLDDQALAVRAVHRGAQHSRAKGD